MKRFTVINEFFTCQVCGKQNEPAPKTCRNHCKYCLCSKHVDINPGDRAENCHGILEPIGVSIKGGDIDKIEFLCKKCGKKGRNKIVEDDNKEILYKLMEKKAFL